MDEKLSPWTKFDSLTTNIFEFTTLAVWTLQNLSLIINLNTNVMLLKSTQKAKYLFIFSTISTLQQQNLKFWQNRGWVVHAGYL